MIVFDLFWAHFKSATVIGHFHLVLFCSRPPLTPSRQNYDECSSFDSQSFTHHFQNLLQPGTVNHTFFPHFVKKYPSMVRTACRCHLVDFKFLVRRILWRRHDVTNVVIPSSSDFGVRISTKPSDFGADHPSDFGVTIPLRPRPSDFGADNWTSESSNFGVLHTLWLIAFKN